MKNFNLGSHNSFKKPDYLKGTVSEVKHNQATALMIFTGPPQSTFRTSIELCFAKEGMAELKALSIPKQNFVVHAPYIANLASLDPAKWQRSVDFFSNELKRSHELGAGMFVLHPGSALTQDRSLSLKQVAKAVNLLIKYVHENNLDIKIAVETMAGKGSEVGITFTEIAEIIHTYPDPDLGVCIDTCHIFDAGYDIKDYQAEVFAEFKNTVGIDKLFLFHINDSLHGLSSHKDRHANIGKGKIGLGPLKAIVQNPEFLDIPKILETPVGTDTDIYLKEIQMLSE